MIKLMCDRCGKIEVGDITPDYPTFNSYLSCNPYATTTSINTTFAPYTNLATHKKCYYVCDNCMRDFDIFMIGFGKGETFEEDKNDE